MSQIRIQIQELWIPHKTEQVTNQPTTYLNEAVISWLDEVPLGTSTSQEIPRSLWQHKIDYRSHDIPPILIILSRPIQSKTSKTTSLNHV